MVASRRGWIALKADPITFAGDDLGSYAVDVNANDLATRGARPRWFLMTLLLPEGKTRATDVERVFADVDRACHRLGVVLCGGHTEISAGLSRPILAGAMLGTPWVRRPLKTAGARPGDRLLLSKGIAIEGTSLLAEACRGRLERRFSARMLRRAAKLLRTPGISVVRDARLALGARGVHAMHDPTEGGLATALHEMAEAAAVGLEIEAEEIPVLPETGALCDALRLDPLGLLASGSLLVAASARRAPAILARWRRAGIQGACIGKAVERAYGRRLRTAGRMGPLPRFERDEVARLLGKR